jgi:NAD(P)-dependent dehydrogenase (short-subunit alcohol dehydrogenase family)
MAVVLVTGMSGTGKSAALAELARRGHRVVDTDYGGYAEEVPSSGQGGFEQVWREDQIEALLDGHDEGVMFISGCDSNHPLQHAAIIQWPCDPDSESAAASSAATARSDPTTRPAPSHGFALIGTSRT